MTEFENIHKRQNHLDRIKWFLILSTYRELDSIILDRESRGIVSFGEAFSIARCVYSWIFMIYLRYLLVPFVNSRYIGSFCGFVHDEVLWARRPTRRWRCHLENLKFEWAGVISHGNITRGPSCSNFCLMNAGNKSALSSLIQPHAVTWKTSTPDASFDIKLYLDKVFSAICKNNLFFIRVFPCDVGKYILMDYVCSRR